MHNLGYRTTVVKSKDEFEEKSNIVYEEIMSDSYVDYCDIGAIKWLPEVQTIEEARKSVSKAWNEDEHHSYAINFTEKLFTNYIKLQDRLEAEKKKLKDYEEKSAIKNHKSATVGCDHCGSKLATKYMNSHYCPLCNHDLYSKTIKDTISRYRTNISDLEKKVRDYPEKDGRVKQTKILLAVSFDYHT